MENVQLHVLFFAAARERAGNTEQWISLSAPCTLNDVKIYLFNELPSLKELNPYLRWAINQSFESNDERVLNSGDVIALIPPISGG